MIRYIGGKSRLAKKLVNAMLPHAAGKKRLIEPFFGGGGMLLEIGRLKLEHIASDSNADLIAMFQKIQTGWKPPRVSEEQYKKLKHAEPSPLRTWAGYALSFGGKWFAGYTRDKNTGRDLIQESHNRLEKFRPKLGSIEFACRQFSEVKAKRGDFFYCDPPYAGTLGYGQEFNHAEFFECCRKWVKAGATVCVSEYTAPEDFKEIYSQSYSTCIHHEATGNVKTEKLFLLG